MAIHLLFGFRRLWSYLPDPAGITGRYKYKGRLQSICASDTSFSKFDLQIWEGQQVICFEYQTVRYLTHSNSMGRSEHSFLYMRTLRLKRWTSFTQEAEKLLGKLAGTPFVILTPSPHHHPANFLILNAKKLGHKNVIKINIAKKKGQLYW